MKSDDDMLHIVKLRLDLAEAYRLARRGHLPFREVDLGYLVHCQMAGLFGNDAPQPFALRKIRGRTLDVLGYSRAQAGDLAKAARACAEPQIRRSWDGDAVTSKPMPSRWPTGRVLGFEMRLCPVVRMARDGPKWRKGSEVDAFLAHCWRLEDPEMHADREAVYHDWLRAGFERHGGAELVSARMHRFKRERLLRRTHEKTRKSRRCERPDATMVGTLAVTDSDAFRRLLARGLGRHRAFGFGMLLLRREPPG